MRKIGLLLKANLGVALASLVALLVTLQPGAVSAKTPDGIPPSQETVCSGLTGAAFGLCNAYCEAQDCDVHPRPSCERLRRNFARITGSAVFPCDAVCGDGMVSPSEECDPPGSACVDGSICTPDCTCQSAPTCGNGILEPGEECDPAGVPCLTGVPCNADCTCEEPTGCCECPPSPNQGPMCTEARPTDCLNHGCMPGAAGSTCDPAVGRCVTPPPSICCQCGATAPTMCFDAATVDECALQNCTAVPNASCGANGLCQ